MSQNTDLVRKMIDCYNSMDADGLAEVLAPDCRHTCPGSDFGAEKGGAEAIVSYFRNDVFSAFHEVRFDVAHLFEDPKQDTVIVEWESHLKPKSGKNYSNNGAFVIECADGKIQWVREYFDTQKSHENVS